MSSVASVLDRIGTHRTQTGNESKDDRQVAAPLRVEFPADMENLEQPPQLVRGLVQTGSLVLVYGESNCGKSTLAIDLGMAVARGTDWRGRRVRQGLVLHVAGEGRHGLRARILAYLQDRQIPAAGIPYGIVDALDLVNATDIADLLASIRECEVRVGAKLELLIIDTLARCAAIDENSGPDMRLVVAACDRIRAETGAAVILIHHAGKDIARGARGHSSLRAAVDTELLIEGATNPRRISNAKQRDLPTCEPLAFNLEAVTIGQDHEAHESITAVVVRHEGVELPRRKPSGQRQCQLLNALETRAIAGERVWTDADLRRIGRELGMTKDSARSAALGLSSAGYLRASIGGFALVIEGASRDRVEKVETG